MQPHLLRLRPLALFLMVPILGAGNCKKPVAPPPAPPTVQAIEVKLQVASVDPAAVQANTATSIKVFGSGFKSGAEVNVGPVAGQQVRVLGENSLSVFVPDLSVGTYDITVTNVNGESSTLRGGLTVRSGELSCRSATVLFGFDKDGLDSGGRGVLDGHMSCYQSAGGAIKVEGHADERGTVDYNLALGQRRADAVRRHLTSGGVSASRITTVSFGEERPADRGHNEGAWRQNRRADISASE